MICVNIYIFWYMVGAFMMAGFALAWSSFLYHGGGRGVFWDILGIVLWPISLASIVWDVIQEWRHSS